MAPTIVTKRIMGAMTAPPTTTTGNARNSRRANTDVSAAKTMSCATVHASRHHPIKDTAEPKANAQAVIPMTRTLKVKTAKPEKEYVKMAYAPAPRIRSGVFRREAIPRNAFRRSIPKRAEPI